MNVSKVVCQKGIQISHQTKVGEKHFNFLPSALLLSLAKSFATHSVAFFIDSTNCAIDAELPKPGTKSSGAASTRDKNCARDDHAIM